MDEDTEAELDLGLELSSKEKVFWTTVLENSKRNKENHENELKVINEVIRISEEKIAIEDKLAENS